MANRSLFRNRLLPLVVSGAGLAVALTPAAPLAAENLRVGSGCTYATIAAAVAAAVGNGAASDLILVRANSPQTIAATVILDLAVAGTVEIVGGYANCTDELPTPGARTSVSVPSTPAFAISNPGSTRFFTLKQLSILASGGAGRLLDLTGSVVATINDAVLRNGEATDGGNIRMAGDDVILILDNDASVDSGDASGDGGGIHCSGGGTIGLLDGAVEGNSADGDGGGIYLDDCLLNSFAGGGGTACPAPTGLGVLCNSAGAVGDAGRGGGIFATNGSDVNLIGSSTVPATLAGNRADFGGGLYLDGATTSAQVEDSEVKDNLGSRGGGGIAVQNGAQLTLRATIPACARGPRCSLVAGNDTGSIVGSDSPGGGIWVGAGGDADIRRTQFTGNSAALAHGASVGVQGDGSFARLEGVVIHAELSRPFYAFEGGDMSVGFVSVWGNSTGGGGSFFAEDAGSSIGLVASLGLDAQVFAPAGAGATYFADCLVARSFANLPPPPDPGSFELVASADVVLADPASGNPHLRGDSPAIDFCDTFYFPPVDLDIDAQPRGTDVPAIPNVPFGPYDLGADEWSALFVDGFESGNCSAWSSDTGGC